jgi:hypothetical protein
MKRHATPATALVALISLVTVSPPALAYLDPSTGSMILSAIIGLFATAALAVKTYWYRLKAFLRGDRKHKSEPAEDQGPVVDRSGES